MVPFRIESGEETGGVATVILSGRLNAASAPEAKGWLKALVGSGSKNLVLDLGGLTFIDSSGLSALVAGYRASAELGGNLKLAAMESQVFQVFALTHLDRVFEIFGTVEAALASFAR
ncbi:MAG: STAS domain-containing protein [Spirochaetes bacterium]|nr:STAS domain-containing protein [Spirochaetota bacterium]MBU1079788.1 STAS domain-containing protein [Spirochaetota bacterium]